MLIGSLSSFEFAAVTASGLGMISSTSYTVDLLTAVFFRSQKEAFPAVFQNNLDYTQAIILLVQFLFSIILVACESQYSPILWTRASWWTVVGLYMAFLVVREAQQVYLFMGIRNCLQPIGRKPSKVTFKLIRNALSFTLVSYFASTCTKNQEQNIWTLILLFRGFRSCWIQYEITAIEMLIFGTVDATYSNGTVFGNFWSSLNAPQKLF